LDAPEFYRCGVCGQLFWPGEKYENTMATLKGLALSSRSFGRAGALRLSRST